MVVIKICQSQEINVEKRLNLYHFAFALLRFAVLENQNLQSRRSLVPLYSTCTCPLQIYYTPFRCKLLWCVTTYFGLSRNKRCSKSPHFVSLKFWYDLIYKVNEMQMYMLT